MRYIIFLLMVIACPLRADTHKGKLTYAQADRLLSIQIAGYTGQYDEILPSGDPDYDYGSNKPNPITEGNNK